MVPSTTAETLHCVLVYSLWWLAKGVWPNVDHTGQPFEPGTRRAQMAGKPLVAAEAGPVAG
eukprot:14550934-Alexandrium_andersonii.AAC.1